MNRKYGIGAATGGANNWTPRQRTAWQAERQYGKLLPMHQPKPSLLSWIMGR